MSRAMYPRGRTACAFALASTLAAVTLMAYRALAQTLPPPPTDVTASPGAEAGAARGEAAEDLQYLKRGPVHEAFAEVYSDGSEAGLVAPKQPPEPIDEVPPDHRLAGDEVVWIPGYWAWDEGREDFIWISGIWRKVPPGRQWVPGTWTRTSEGWQWSSGFWASVTEDEIEYLPPPPDSLEQGPSVDRSAEGQFYIPGSWQYYENDYRWRPGYWSNAYDDWVWVPDRYVWTPRGCIFRRGYWDYLPTTRGLLFSPVYFHRPVYLAPRYYYVPRYVVDVGPSFFVHLFVRPHYGHYYFGDYYADHYRRYSIFPWVNVWTHHHHYDPLFAFYHYGSGYRSFVPGIRSWHAYFERHEQFRPHHRFDIDGRADLRGRGDVHLDDDVAAMTSLGARLDHWVDNRGRDLRLERVGDDARERIRNMNDPLRTAQRQRAEFESRFDQRLQGGGPGRGNSGRGNLGRGEGERDTLRLPEVAARQRALLGDQADRLEQAAREAEARGRGVGREARGRGVDANDLGRQPGNTLQDAFRGRLDRDPSGEAELNGPVGRPGRGQGRDIGRELRDRGDAELPVPQVEDPRRGPPAGRGPEGFERRFRQELETPGGRRIEPDRGPIPNVLPRADDRGRGAEGQGRGLLDRGRVEIPDVAPRGEPGIRIQPRAERGGGPPIRLESRPERGSILQGGPAFRGGDRGDSNRGNGNARGRRGRD